MFLKWQFCLIKKTFICNQMSHLWARVNHILWGFVTLPCTTSRCSWHGDRSSSRTTVLLPVASTNSGIGGYGTADLFLFFAYFLWHCWRGWRMSICTLLVTIYGLDFYLSKLLGHTVLEISSTRTCWGTTRWYAGKLTQVLNLSSTPSAGQLSGGKSPSSFNSCKPDF